MTKVRIFLFGTLAAITLAGCGQPTDAALNPTPQTSLSSSASEPGANPASLNLDDATWLAMMLAHHDQAVQMSDFALTQTKSTEIKDLATAIRGAQYPEMEYMNGLLYEGGYTEPIDVSEHMAHMQGMLTADQLAALGALSGTEFDKNFLNSMIAHHEGAVAMSENMLVSGSNTKIKELATKIVEAQNQEIVKMQVMLGALQ